jgi:hypothetical protein
VSLDVEGAFQASLQRSRARRAAVAARVAVLRRRRRRGGGSMAVVVATLAFGAPLAVAQSSAEAPAPLLQAGATGSAVTQLQAALGVTQTGTWSAALTRAVRSYQRHHGLEVDGIVGPKTAASLGLGAAPVAGEASAPTISAAASTRLDKIAACESGGDPTAVSPDRRYRGKYQFSRATWKAMGGSGDPAKAPESEQDTRAASLLAQAGTSPWPVCGE